MKRLLSFGLFFLLMYHTLGHLLVLLSVRWQEQHELSERLTVYASVDHMVEFHVPLRKHPDVAVLAQDRQEGFKYRGNYYEIVDLAVSGDTLHITGYVNEKYSFWEKDLLSLVKDQFANDSETAKKTGNLLKLLLKEYSPAQRSRIWFFLYDWRENVRVPDGIVRLLSRSLSIHSPPPETFV